MRLYHGSTVVVTTPKILEPSRTLDYGKGFYTTTSIEQAELWVKRHLSRNLQQGYINVYELCDDFKDIGLNILWFESPTEEWVDFVMNNRMNKKYVHDYDIVYGPVANDKVYAAFALYESGLLDKNGLINELRTYSLIDQFLFHTPKSLKCLTFIEAKEVFHE